MFGMSVFASVAVEVRRPEEKLPFVTPVAVTELVAVFVQASVGSLPTTHAVPVAVSVAVPVPVPVW
jgi:hypothetical protein